MCFFLVSFSNLSNVDPNNRNSRKYKRKITYLYSLWWFICTMIDVWQKWYWKKGSIFWVLPALIIISSHYYWTSRYVVRRCKHFFTWLWSFNNWIRNDKYLDPLHFRSWVFENIKAEISFHLTNTIPHLNVRQGPEIKSKFLCWFNKFWNESIEWPER